MKSGIVIGVKEKMYFTIFLGLVLIVVTIVYGLMPLFKSAMSYQSEYKSSVEKLRIMNKKILTLENYNQEDLSQKLNVMIKAIPKEKDFVGTITTLRSAAASAGLILSNLSTSPKSIEASSSASTENGSQPNSLSYELNILGTGEQMRRFLENIDNSLPFLYLPTFVFSGSSNDSQVFSGSLSIFGFYSPDQQILGGLDAPIAELTEQEEQLLTKLASLPTPIVEVGSVEVGSEPLGKTNPFGN